MLESLRLALPRLMPKPNDNGILLELFFLFIIFVVQEVVLAQLFRFDYVVVDILTPWLTIIFIRQRLLSSIIYCLFVSFLLETHSATPVGMYLCIYSVIAVTIVNIRGALSWRHFFPWMVVYGLSALWVIGFETFVYRYADTIDMLSMTYWLSCAARVLIAVAIGMILSRNFRQIDAEEPTPT